jgi:esterase/lipase
MRSMRYTSRSPEAARAWQEALRTTLFERLHMSDLVADEASLPLDPEVTATETREGVTLETVRLRATPGRVFQAVVARATDAKGPLPAVVCIHGHGGNRMAPFDPEETIYKEFGLKLAQRGFVVISTDVGQHEVYENDRILMGERLWNLMRCVDYLRSLPDVDSARIGCAGLSLGGEMAMWLGAMDPRVTAVVSAGFLTMMDHMEQNHCMCWKFDGLRELADFPDIYALIAPRPLQCQNGLKEPETQFNVPLAKKAMEQVQTIYRDYGALDKVTLDVHPGAHDIDFGPMLGFLSTHLLK